jgi:hypothetical protein
MKGKFKFSSINKDEKNRDNNESEVFNISELKKYYVDFSEKAKSIKI